MKIVYALLFLCFCASAVQAGPYCSMPGASERFCKADTDKSDSLSPEEFQTAFPDMTKEAFSMLDADRNGVIDGAEWDAFLGRHEASRKNGMGGMGMPGNAPTEEPATPPLITPPAK